MLVLIGIEEASIKFNIDSQKDPFSTIKQYIEKIYFKGSH